jgi:LysM repeat protein
MDAKRIILALLMIAMPLSAGLGQDKATPAPQTAKNDIEALKAQLKEHEERINKLSQEIAKLNEALSKQKSTATPSSPDTAGVDNPTPADTKTHIVAKGETLSAIAKAYGVSVQDIEQLNKIEDAKKLQAGQTIKIPQTATGSPSPSPSSTP